MVDLEQSERIVLGYDVRKSNDEGYRGMDSNIWEWPLGLSSENALAEFGWLGANGTLWSSLTKLKSWVQFSQNYRAPDAALIAIAVLKKSIPADVQLPCVGMAYVHLDDAKPSVVQGDWKLLGYDVGDAFFSTILSPTPENLALNPNGLIKEVELAMELVAIAGKNSPEHAPFMVYAVYEIPA